MNDPHLPDSNPRDLLDRATGGLTPDVDRLVAGGIARGRRVQRRRRAASMLAAVAVFGVIGAAASFVPALGHGGHGVPVAGSTTSPTPSVSPSSATSTGVPTQSPSPSPTDSPSVSTPPDADGKLTIAVTAEDVPAAVEELLGRSGAGDLRLDPPYGAASDGGRVIAHFSWQGTLATFVLEPFDGDVAAGCSQGASSTGGTCTTDAAGEPMLLWGPTTADGVSAQGASVWRDGFEVSLLSYNAADGKDSQPLFAQPPLTMDDLRLLATSDRWFD